MKGKELKTAREQLDWSQQKLGDAIGVNRSTILRYESGELDIPKRSEIALKKVFKERGIKVDD